MTLKLIDWIAGWLFQGILIAIVIQGSAATTHSARYGSICNAKTQDLCNHQFTCQHFKGCELGRCVCHPGSRYNFTNHTCYVLPPLLQLKHGEVCASHENQVCAHGLVCKKCDWARYGTLIRCRRPATSKGDAGTGNRTYDDSCSETSDCGPTLTCEKSDDCQLGRCRCALGFFFNGRLKPCVADSSPVAPVAVGESCNIQDRKRPCVNNSRCTMCPGRTVFTCVSNHVTHTSKTHKLQPSVGVTVATVTAGVNYMAVYVAVPIAVVVLAIVLFVVWRKSSLFRRGHFSRLLESPSNQQII